MKTPLNIPLVTILISNADDGNNLTQHDWAYFIALVDNAVHQTSKVIHFAAAHSPNNTDFDGYCWVATTKPKKDADLLVRLAQIALRYSLGSIMMTTGTGTKIVGAAP